MENKNKILVVKIGTSILRLENGFGLNKNRIKAIISQVAKLYSSGYKVVLVSSGAIALGMQLLKLRSRPKKLDELQAVASVGQGMLIKFYNDLFKNFKLLGSQVLLTYDDFTGRERYLNAKNTMLKLLQYNTVPVVNENDAVATEEIKFGDNDKLSALVASLIGARELIILSDVDGLYDANGKLIEEVAKIDKQLQKMAYGTKNSTVCIGGMVTKLEAASITCNANIPCIIANGLKKDILIDIINDKFRGTVFIPSGKKLAAKKSWLAFGSKPKGTIVIDSGAKTAILNGKSLLAVGVVDVLGQFKTGDVVALANKEDNLILAKGISKCGSEELKAIKGTHFEHEIIHRDNLVIAKE